MENFIQFVTDSLLNHSKDVKIIEMQNKTGSKLELHIPISEAGKVIGKHGIMADSLRTITQFYGLKVLKKNLSFRIVENGCTD